MDHGKDWTRIAGAACGALFVVLVLAGDSGEKPAENASDEEVAMFFQTHPPTTWTWVGVFLELLGLLAFVVFAVTLGSLLESGEGGARVLSRTALGAALIMVAVKIASLPAYILLLARADQGRSLDPSVAGVLFELNNTAFAVTWATIALFLLAASLAIILKKAIPRWLGWFGLVGAIALLEGFADQTNPLGVFAYLGFLAWTIVISVVLVRKAWRFQPAAAARAGPAGAPPPVSR